MIELTGDNRDFKRVREAARELHDCPSGAEELELLRAVVRHIGSSDSWMGDYVCYLCEVIVEELWKGGDKCPRERSVANC